MRRITIAVVLVLLALAAILAVFLAPQIARAQTCLTTNPLYGIASGDEGAKSDWYFAGVAGPVSNGYTGTVYVSIFNPSTSQTAAGTVDEFQETAISDPAHPLLIFGQGFSLPPNRSKTLAFNGQAPNGDPITVPNGKVHFHVYGAVVNVYAEQWLTC